MKNHTSEEIKNRLSNIGEAIGAISLEYIVSLEKENEQLKKDFRVLEGIADERYDENTRLKAQIEKMKCCHSCQAHKLNDLKNCQTCDDNYSEWRLAE